MPVGLVELDVEFGQAAAKFPDGTPIEDLIAVGGDHEQPVAVPPHEFADVDRGPGAGEQHGKVAESLAVPNTARLAAEGQRPHGSLTRRQPHASDARRGRPPPPALGPEAATAPR